MRFQLESSLIGYLSICCTSTCRKREKNKEEIGELHVRTTGLGELYVGNIETVSTIETDRKQSITSTTTIVSNFSSNRSSNRSDKILSDNGK